MDNILKTKFIQLKEHFNFNVDLKNIKFYKNIKKVFNTSLFLFFASVCSFATSVFILDGFILPSAHFFISLIFLPFFLSVAYKLNIKFQPKFTSLHYKLPSFFKKIPFIKSAEDSFLFSREKIAHMLSQKECQLVFFDFFSMAKSHIFKYDEHKKFTKNIVLFKSYLETENFLKAADYFIELYGDSYKFEYLIHDNHPSTHDLDLLHARKKMIDDFLHQNSIDDLTTQNLKAKSLEISKDFSEQTTTERKKVDWKKLMND